MLDLATAFGIQRSVAQIYGLLFVAPQALALEEIASRLGISMGSASQGLRFLRNVGAAIPVVHPGDRRTLYEAETRLKVLLPGFLKEQLQPRLETWPQRVAHLRDQAKQCSGDQERIVRDRCRQLEGWMSKTRIALPLLLKTFSLK